MNIIRNALAVLLAALFLAAPLGARAETGLPQPAMEAGGAGAETDSAVDETAVQDGIPAGGCVIEAGGLTLKSDADTVFSVLEGENGRTVLVRSGGMDFALTAQAGNTEFATPFGAVTFCLADMHESARGSVLVDRDTATLTVTQGELLLASEKEERLPAGRVLVLTDAGGEAPSPTVSEPRTASVTPRVAIAFGGVSALAAGGLILAGMAGEGGSDDSREISPY